MHYVYYSACLRCRHEFEERSNQDQEIIFSPIATWIAIQDMLLPYMW